MAKDASEAGKGPRGRPRTPLEPAALHPAVHAWAAHATALVDAAFPRRKDAADALGVAAPYLSRILSGERMPTRAWADGLARHRTSGTRNTDTRALFMAALRITDPPTWRAHDLEDRLIAAWERERELSEKAARSERLEQELARTRAEADRLAGRLLRALDELDVRRAEIRLLRAQLEDSLDRWGQQAMDIRAVRHARGSAWAYAALAVASAGAALTVPDWPGQGVGRVGGWSAAALFVLLNVPTLVARTHALKRLAVSGNGWVHALAAALGCAVLTLVAVTVGLGHYATADTYRVRATATLSDPRASWGPNGTGSSGTGVYWCRYTWHVDGRTHSARDECAEREGQEHAKVPILLDPGDLSKHRLTQPRDHWFPLYLCGPFGLLLTACAVGAAVADGRREQRELARLPVSPHAVSGPAGPPDGATLRQRVRR